MLAATDNFSNISVTIRLPRGGPGGLRWQSIKTWCCISFYVLAKDIRKSTYKPGKLVWSHGFRGRSPYSRGPVAFGPVGRQFIMEDVLQETAHVTKSRRQRERMRRGWDTDNLLQGTHLCHLNSSVRPHPWKFPPPPSRAVGSRASFQCMDLWMTFKVQDTATIHFQFSSQRMDNFYCFEAECVHRDNSNLMSSNEPGCWAT